MNDLVMGDFMIGKEEQKPVEDKERIGGRSLSWIEVM